MRISISFSGGRTSAVMTKLILDNYPHAEKVITFANTGAEHPKTLEFVHNCDKYWGFNTVWLEAVVNPDHGKGVTHKIVDFSSASRNGEPFEAMIQKYGIPNPTTPQCTARLKTDVMLSYLRSLGWKNKTYWTAIGIRADEIDRMNANYKSQMLWYPLIDWQWDKQKVNSFMAKQPFDLDLPSDAFGNCCFCWKKSFRKLATVAQKEPWHFDFPKRMEEKYRFHKPAKAANPETGERLFYRRHRKVEDIFAIAQDSKFVPYEDSKQMSIWDELDLGGSCNDGCEVDFTEGLGE